MKMICGEDAAESFAVFPARFPVPEDVADGAVSVSGSNVANGSRRAPESGLPRRSLGLFGSSIGSPGAEVEPDADAFVVSVAAGAFAASGALGGLGALAGGAVVGGAVGVAGFCWSFLSLSESLSACALSL